MGKCPFTICKAFSFIYSANLHWNLWGIYSAVCWGYENEQEHLSHVRGASAVLNENIVTKQCPALSEGLAVLCTGPVLIHSDDTMTLWGTYNYYFYFTDEESRCTGKLNNCPRPENKSMSEIRFMPRQPGSKRHSVLSEKCHTSKHFWVFTYYFTIPFIYTSVLPYHQL